MGTYRWHSSNLSAVLCRLINRLPDYHAPRMTPPRVLASIALRALNAVDCMRVRVLCVPNQYFVLYDVKLLIHAKMHVILKIKIILFCHCTTMGHFQTKKLTKKEQLKEIA